MDYEFLIMTAITILCFYVRLKYGIICLFLWIFFSMFGFFFTSNGLDMILEPLSKSEIFYKKFVGDYQTLYSKLSQFHSIKRKFRLPLCFKPFGIFYDNPEEQKDGKCRCIFGILLDVENKQKDFKDFNDQEFRNYMKENEFSYGEIPKTECIYGIYDCFFSVMNSFIFIAKIYIKMTNLKFFTRMYNPKWKDGHMKKARKSYKKKCGVLEIYDHKVMRFYIPISSEDNFFFYK